MNTNIKQFLLILVLIFSIFSSACAKKGFTKSGPKLDSSTSEETTESTINENLSTQEIALSSNSNTVTTSSSKSSTSSTSITNSTANTTTTIQIVSAEPAPLLNKVADFIYPDKALLPGSSFTVDFNNIRKGEPGDDVGMTYSCTILALSELASSAASQPYPCSQADGVSFDTVKGILTAIPPVKSVGSFKIKVVGSNSNTETSSSEFYVSVRDPYPRQNLVLDLDARFSHARVTPAVPSLPRWFNLASNLIDTEIIGTPQWKGDNTRANPLRHEFNQAGYTNSLKANTKFSALSRFSFTMLGSLASPTSLGNVIAGTVKEDKGWSLRQSVSKPGKVELVAGQTYQDLVLSHNPVGYWRLNETSGTTAKDISGNGGNATYYATSGSYSLGSSAPLVNDTSTGVTMKNYSRIIAPASSKLNVASTITISVWFKPDGVNGYQPLVEYGKNVMGAIGVHLWQYADQKTAYVNFRDSNRGDHAMSANSANYPILINQWNHVVAVYDGNIGYLYVNGKKAAAQTLGSFTLHTSEDLQIGMREGNYGCYWYTCWAVHNPYQGEIAEVSIFKKPLNDAEAIALYDAGKGKTGSICYSKKEFSANIWNAFAGIVDPSDKAGGLKLYANGNEECSSGMNMPESQIVSPGPLTLGAAPEGAKPWSGSIADFKMYSGDSGSAAAPGVLSLIQYLYQSRIP